MRLSASHLAIALCLLATVGLAGPPAEPAGVEPIGSAKGNESLNELLSHMVRSQLEGCPGVEVHKRGAGFVAGQFNGPIVLVSMRGRCEVVPHENRPPKAVVITRWATHDPTSHDEIAVLERTIDVGGPACPTDFMAPALKRAVEPAVDHLCREAFVPMRENVSLADFFFPIMSPLGTVRMSADPGVILLERGGHTFEMKGRITCQPPSNVIENELLGMSAMRSLVLDGDLTLRHPASGATIGRWSETIVSALGVSCDVAFRQKASEQRVADAQTRFEERIFVATERVLEELPRTTTPPKRPAPPAKPPRGRKDTGPPAPATPTLPTTTTTTTTTPAPAQPPSAATTPSTTGEPLQELSLTAEYSPLLSDLGRVTSEVDDAGREVVVLRQGARTFRIEGSLVCVLSDRERIEKTTVNSYMIMADIIVREPDRRTIIGRWREPSGFLLGLNCDVATSLTGGNGRQVKEFRELLRRRVVEAINR